MEKIKSYLRFPSKAPFAWLIYYLLFLGLSRLYELLINYPYSDFTWSNLRRLDIYFDIYLGMFIVSIFLLVMACVQGLVNIIRIIIKKERLTSKKVIITTLLLLGTFLIYTPLINNLTRSLTGKSLVDKLLWKNYKDKDIGINFIYPFIYRVKPVRLDLSDSKHLYIYSDKNEEIIRIHYYPNSCDKEVGDFLIGTKNINNISWQIKLFPKGLDSGEFKLTEPILDYIVCQNGNKYSLEFKNRTTLDATQSKIIRNFFIQQ